jgi:hypothetical protein
MSKIEKLNKVLKKTKKSEVVTRMVLFSKKNKFICYGNFLKFLYLNNKGIFILSSRILNFSQKIPLQLSVFSDTILRVVLNS